MDLQYAQDFARLGLNGRQSAVYMALLTLSEATAIELAHTAKLKHPTVYDALEVLEKRMLVTRQLRNGKNIFIACHPENLNRTEEIRQQALSRLLPELAKLYNFNGPKIKIQTINGDEILTVCENELLNCRDKEYFFFGQLSVIFRRQSLEYEESYLEKRLEKNIRSHAIRLKEDIEEPQCMRGSPQNLREVRYISSPLSGDIAELYLYDSKVLIISSIAEKYAILIDCSDLHALLMGLWRIVWQSAEPSA